MKLQFTLTNDRELLHLFISGIAVATGLMWMFFGQAIILATISETNQAILYYFFSGIIFSITFIGLYVFVRSILNFTEFIINTDKLISIMFENLLEEEYEGIFLKNKQGVYKYISPLARSVLGIENKSIIGLTDFDIHLHSQASKIAHEDHQILHNGESISWETTVNNNHKENYSCKKIPCRDQRGNIVGIIGLCRNISMLKAYEDSNRQQDERYNDLFNKLPYPVLLIDTVSLRPISFNDAMHNLLGYTKNEFSQMRLSLHIEPDALLKFQNTIKNIINNNGGEFETQMVTRQRDIVDVTGYAQKIMLDDNVYLHLLLYDNTENKKATDILINSELKYRSLFEHANDAIIVVSPNTLNIIDANEIALATLGYTRDTLLLMTIQDLDESRDHSFTQSKLTELEIYNHALYEHDIKNRVGDKLQVEINAHKLNYGEEEVYQFVLRNISARKKTEADLRRSEYRYRQMFESNMAVKLVINPDEFIIEDANPAAAHFYGYTIEQLQGMDLAKINILSREKLNTLILRTREQNLGFYSCPHRLANGEVRFVEVRDGLMEIDDKKLFYSIINDVTASKEAENQVLVASKMFDYSTDAVMLINDNNQVVSVNYAFTQITGFQQSEILNAAPEIILADKKDTLLNNNVLAALNENNQWKGEFWHRLKGGQSRPLNVSINRIQNDLTGVASYVAIFSPKNSNIIQFENEIHYVELTQLPNKSLFVDRLAKAIDRAHRNKSHLGIILIDFAEFSDINKRFGYDVGDKILRAISKRLQYNTRDSDTLSHFLSDDFAVLVEDLQDIQQIGIVAQKLLSTLAEDYLTPNQQITLNVSMGISVYPEDGDATETLIHSASAALVTAQQVPGSHFELTSDTMNMQANLLLNAEASLHQALRQNQLVLLYLPQINVQSGQLDSVEALIRWLDPHKGYILPEQFLPGSEQSGFIGAIGYHVIEQAFKQCRLWINHQLGIPAISINVYQSQLDNDLQDVLVQKCKKYALDPQHITLEFSEAHFIEMTREQINILHGLQDHQFKICIEDFGQSLSSLNFISKCSVDSMKIDPCLIKQALNSAESEKLLKGIVSFCDSQNIILIAEGVESEKDYEYLRTLGINHMQGYLFSKPLQTKDMAGYINSLNHNHT